MKKYAEYKDSGIEWIGEIPKDWKIVRLKHVFQQVKNAIKVGPFGSQLKGDDFIDEGYKVYNQRSVLDNDFINGDAFISEEKYKDLLGFKLNPLDVLITTRGTIGKIAIVPQNVDEGIIHPCIIKFSPDWNRIDKRFITYIFNDTQITIEQLVVASNATTIPVIYSDPLKNVYFALPSLKTQQTIADYLDKKAAVIDILIEDKQKLINLLKEKRQAIISEVVTKGLDKNAKMKDSGIEQIGEIPEGWDISRMGFESWVRARLGWKGLKAEEYVDEGYAFLSTPNIKDSEIDFDNVNYISKDRFDESPEIKIRVGDILLAKDGSTLGTINVVRTLPKETTVNSSIAVITPNKRLHSIYLYYLFQSNYIKNIIQMEKGGMGVPHLFQGDIVKFNIIVPPENEQNIIADYLDTRTAQIDIFITDIALQNQKLKEYRQSIISEAVTGKVAI